MALFENIVTGHSAGSSPGPRGVRILAVEDDPQGQHAIERVLERAGHRVTVAGDLQAALDALSSSEFDLVISDFRLPGGTGLDLLATQHGSGSSIPFIFLSGDLDQELRRRAQEMGAVAFLRKPVALHDLFDHMNRALAV